MTTVAIIQARLGSSRLPGKVLLDLFGKPVLAWVVQAAQAIPGVEKVMVATGDDSENDPIAHWCQEQGVPCHRGSESDVLSRFADAARVENATTIIRLTADCPFIDPHVCGQVLALLRHKKADYACNNHPASWPDGLDCEVMTAEALYKAEAEARRPTEREHVTPYIRANRRLFKSETLYCSIAGLAGERWTLDSDSDYRFLSALAALLPSATPPAFTDILKVLDSNKSLAVERSTDMRDAGYVAGLKSEPHVFTRSYKQSTDMLARAEAVIPLGAQTFSKSKVQFPVDHSPLFLTHGEGARVWDVDGNEYVDTIAALLPVILGYCDPDVDGAVRDQTMRGVSFSLATELETVLAEKLVDLIPCAEMVRFGKNGTDATSAAIRLSRAFTGRDRVGVVGYHGWQDWYIGSTARHKGVPQDVRNLTHRLPYNDIDGCAKVLAAHPDEFAAVILEPANMQAPKDGFLGDLRDLVHAHGGLLVFDEVITGFRFHIGGAQTYFDVVPDLACFGKAMGNGWPISAVVGRADVMREMEEVFFSGTFGGEAGALAAACATLEKMQAGNVIDGLWSKGNDLIAGIRERISARDLDHVFKVIGYAPWTSVDIVDIGDTRKEAIKTLYIIEMAKAGVLTLGTHNIMDAHTDADLQWILSGYEHTLDVIKDELARGDLETRLPIPPLVPVFQVRS